MPKPPWNCKNIFIPVNINYIRSTEKLKLKTTDKPHKRINKNAPEIKDFNQVAFRFFGGVDFMAIEGLSHATIMTLMSEVGVEDLLSFLLENNLLPGYD